MLSRRRKLHSRNPRVTHSSVLIGHRMVSQSFANGSNDHRTDNPSPLMDDTELLFNLLRNPRTFRLTQLSDYSFSHHHYGPETCAKRIESETRANIESGDQSVRS